MKIEEIINIDNTIPVGWEVVLLDDLVLKIFAGGDKPDEVSNEKTEEFSYPIFSNGLKDKGLYGYSNAYRVDEECITISARGTIGYTEVRTPKFTPIVRLIVIVPTEYTLSKYLKFYFENLIVEKSGTSIPQLTVPMIKPIPIKLPPLNEQKRIVAKIEKLFSNLDNSDKYLLHLEKQLKRYRQSVLKSAFEGKLTKEWRENQTNLETAESLSESVKKYKEKEYSEQLEIWIKVLEDWEKNGKQGNKPRKPSKEKPIKLDEYIETDLPLNWKWEKLGNHAFVTKLAGFEFTKYVTYKELGDIPVIRGQNILKDRFISRNFIYVDREIMEKLPRSRIFGGELLMVFVGAGLGNVGIAPSDKEYFLGPNVAKIALNKFYNNLFIKYYLSSSLGFKNINSHSKATAQDSISMENIRNVNVPFLTLEEQKEIVNQIEKHFSIIDKLEAVVQQSIKESKRLRQSILKQAFEGKLVEQDPNDESASVLLEKIAKAKEEYQKAQKKQVRKK